jgi:ribonuclease D
MENLLTPEHLRQICWLLPEPGEVAGLLANMGARQWQIDIAAPILIGALSESEALEIPEPEEAPPADPAP